MSLKALATPVPSSGRADIREAVAEVLARPAPAPRTIWATTKVASGQSGCTWLNTSSAMPMPLMPAAMGTFGPTR
jgi:hypothetical protein